MIVYADTSGLAKLFLDEDGTAEMRYASGAAERVTSVTVAYVELRAALAAAIRSDRVPVQRRDALTAELERVWSGVNTVSLDAMVLRRAGDLAEQLRLRAYDAVHLAALQEAGAPGEAVFACWDNDLRDAARELGYELLPA